jgi:hypothetical protein
MHRTNSFVGSAKRSSFNSDFAKTSRRSNQQNTSDTFVTHTPLHSLIVSVIRIRILILIHPTSLLIKFKSKKERKKERKKLSERTPKQS